MVSHDSCCPTKRQESKNKFTIACNEKGVCTIDGKETEFGWKVPPMYLGEHQAGAPARATHPAPMPLCFAKDGKLSGTKKDVACFYNPIAAEGEAAGTCSRGVVHSDVATSKSQCPANFKWDLSSA